MKNFIKKSMCLSLAFGLVFISCSAEESAVQVDNNVSAQLISAKSGIGLVGCSVKADVDPHGGTSLQPSNGFFVDQCAVGIEGDEQSHFMQALHDLTKTRI